MAIISYFFPNLSNQVRKMSFCVPDTINNDTINNVFSVNLRYFSVNLSFFCLKWLLNKIFVITLHQIFTRCELDLYTLMVNNK